MVWRWQNFRFDLQDSQIQFFLVHAWDLKTFPETIDWYNDQKTGKCDV